MVDQKERDIWASLLLEGPISENDTAYLVKQTEKRLGDYLDNKDENPEEFEKDIKLWIYLLNKYRKTMSMDDFLDFINIFIKMKKKLWKVIVELKDSQRIAGGGYWYTDPDTDMKTIVQDRFVEYFLDDITDKTRRITRGQYSQIKITQIV